MVLISIKALNLLYYKNCLIYQHYLRPEQKVKSSQVALDIEFKKILENLCCISRWRFLSIFICKFV